MAFLNKHYQFTRYEKNLLLSKAGRINTKYREKCYKIAKFDGFFTDSGDFTQAGLDALEAVLTGSGMSRSTKEVIRKALR